MRGDQAANSLEGVGPVGVLLEGREGGELAVGGRGRRAQGADALGDVVHGQRVLGVFVHEHRVERVEQGPTTFQ